MTLQGRAVRAGHGGATQSHASRRKGAEFDGIIRAAGRRGPPTLPFNKKYTTLRKVSRGLTCRSEWIKYATAPSSSGGHSTGPVDHAREREPGAGRLWCHRLYHLCGAHAPWSTPSNLSLTRGGLLLVRGFQPNSRTLDSYTGATGVRHLHRCYKCSTPAQVSQVFWRNQSYCSRSTVFSIRSQARSTSHGPR